MSHLQMHILAGCFVATIIVLIFAWRRAPYQGGTFRMVISNFIAVWSCILAGLTGVFAGAGSMLMYQQLLLGIPWCLFSLFILVIGVDGYQTISQSYRDWEYEKRKTEILYG